MKIFFKNFLIFCVGFTIYMCIEGVWKSVVSPGGVQHFTMGLLGGVSLLVIGLFNKWCSWEKPLILQAALGGLLITFMEFIFGVILNLWLKLGIWDYSSLPLNIMGQVCIPFFFAWVLLALIAIFIDDFLRWKVYDEEKPHYHWFKWGKCNK